MWREAVRRFIATDIGPFHAHWERDGIVPRELWLKAGAAMVKMVTSELHCEAVDKNRLK